VQSASNNAHCQQTKAKTALTVSQLRKHGQKNLSSKQKQSFPQHEPFLQHQHFHNMNPSHNVNLSNNINLPNNVNLPSKINPLHHNNHPTTSTHSKTASTRPAIKHKLESSKIPENATRSLLHSGAPTGGAKKADLVAVDWRSPRANQPAQSVHQTNLPRSLQARTRTGLQR